MRVWVEKNKKQKTKLKVNNYHRETCCEIIIFFYLYVLYMRFACYCCDVRNMMLGKKTKKTKKSYWHFQNVTDNSSRQSLLLAFVINVYKIQILCRTSSFFFTEKTEKFNCWLVNLHLKFNSLETLLLFHNCTMIAWWTIN